MDLCYIMCCGKATYSIQHYRREILGIKTAEVYKEDEGKESKFEGEQKREAMLQTCKNNFWGYKPKKDCSRTQCFQCA